MALLVPLVGLLVAPVAAVVVYVDAIRRDLSGRERLLWTLVVGLGSCGGFLLPVLFGDVLAHTYLRVVKPTPILVSPLELLALHLAVGTTVVAGGLLLYWTGSRYGPVAGA